MTASVLLAISIMVFGTRGSRRLLRILALLLLLGVKP